MTSRRSVRSRTRRTGRVVTAARGAGRDLADVARAAGRAISSRTRQVRCPYCPGLPWITASAWPGHEAAHKTAHGKKARARQRTDNLRESDRRRREAEARAHDARTRPTNPQADPGGVIHGAMRPQDRAPSPRVRWVDDAGNPTDWRPGDPYPDTDPTPYDQVWSQRFPQTGGGGTGTRRGLLAAVLLLGADGARTARARWRAGWQTDLAAGRRGWAWFVAPFRARPRRATSHDGMRWKLRPHNPGAYAPGVTDIPSNVVPIRPEEPPVPTNTNQNQSASQIEQKTARPAGGKPVRGGVKIGPNGKNGGGTKAPRGGGGTSAGGGGHAEEMASAAMAWARATPETLAGARQDAQTISEGLAGVASALTLRMNMEVDRQIAASCVEPYQEAERLLIQAAERVQEVHARLLQRYGQIAEELAKPDTPDAEYLKYGV